MFGNFSRGAETMDWFEPRYTNRQGIPFGYDANGVSRSVAEVPRGKACECRCPDCDGALVAHKGEVYAHHFKHDAGAECRHALEASLYAMACRILSQPGAQLQLPGVQSRYDWVLKFGYDPEWSFVRRFLAKSAWVIDPVRIHSRPGFTVANSRLKESSWASADLSCDELGLDIHLLSYRKRWPHPNPTTKAPKKLTLGINLSDYFRPLWETCDAERTAMVEELKSDDFGFGEWLATSTSGRGLIYHPDLKAKEHEFEKWASRLVEAEQAKQQRERLQEIEKRRRLAEARRLEDLKWTVPTKLASAEGNEFMLRARESKNSYLNHHTARGYGLVALKADRAGYVWIGKPGDIVPYDVRKLLDIHAGWEPVDSTTQIEALPAPHPLAAFLPKPGQRFVILNERLGWCAVCRAPLDEVRFLDDGQLGPRTIVCRSKPFDHPQSRD